jgi:hypothetical protein
MATFTLPKTSTIGTGTTADDRSIAVGRGAIIGTGDDSSLEATPPPPLGGAMIRRRCSSGTTLPANCLLATFGPIQATNW